MGIPHLISTLEPYAVHDLLDDQSVVIDGPALAYHVLYICNRNGVVLPSYQLLGDTAVAWLDELVRRRVNIEAIYFDGHLPFTKRPVRMERMVKSFRQLKIAHSADPKGRSRSYLSSSVDSFTVSDMFSAKVPPGKPFVPPCFLVPAVIESLRLSHRYGALTRLKPGEADAYCARHLLESGGTVLTSDSDLLAHDLGQGRVVFFRDIYLNGDSRFACATFSPRKICERLGLSSPNQICRLAYERRKDQHLSLSQILRECSKPLERVADYEAFCKEYLHHEFMPLPISQTGHPVQMESLDPRISELVLQFGNTDDTDDYPECQIFLPILIEDPSRGSAWEQTTSTRQLAYTILRQSIPGHCSSVHEYRRVNHTDQKGRQIDLMHQAFAAEFSERLVGLTAEIKKEVGNDELCWILFCLTLDVRHCREEEKQSHVLELLLQASQIHTCDKVSWAVMHFAAQLQAAFYSLRILQQVVSLIPDGRVSPKLYDLLSSMPPLSRFPDIDHVIALLSETQSRQIFGLLKKLVPLPDNLVRESKRKRPNKAKASRRAELTQGSPQTVSRAARNPFDLLSQDD